VERRRPQIEDGEERRKKKDLSDKNRKMHALIFIYKSKIYILNNYLSKK
jgi:hypothetical protein